jgi:hypothetical protein
MNGSALRNSAAGDGDRRAPANAAPDVLHKLPRNLLIGCVRQLSRGDSAEQVAQRAQAQNHGGAEPISYVSLLLCVQYLAGKIGTLRTTTRLGIRSSKFVRQEGGSTCRGNVPDPARAVARGKSSEAARRAQFDSELNRLKRLTLREAVMELFAFNMARAEMGREIEVRTGRLSDEVTRVTAVANASLKVLQRLEKIPVREPDSNWEAISGNEEGGATGTTATAQNSAQSPDELSQLSPAQYDGLLSEVQRKTELHSIETQPNQTNRVKKSA